MIYCTIDLEQIAQQIAHLLGKKSYWERFWDEFDEQHGADWDIDK